MIIGQRIKEQRSKLGLSQQELAVKLDLSIDTIRSLETNRAKPSVETLKKLSDLFECSTDYLLGKIDKDLTYLDILNIVKDRDESSRKAIEELISLAERNEIPKDIEEMMYKLLGHIAKLHTENEKIKQDIDNFEKEK